MQIIYILIGAVAGIFSGFFGLGGGVILIPAMVFLLGMSQHQAQGTTLALLVPPIGLWAAWRYYQSGNVQLSVAMWMCVGFFVGGYVGASCAHCIPSPVLKKLFGVSLFIIGAQMFFSK